MYTEQFGERLHDAYHQTSYSRLCCGHFFHISITDERDRLQDAGYCGSYISILAADNCRENVIRLVPIPFINIAILLSGFVDTLREILIEDSFHHTDSEASTHATAGLNPVRDLVNLCVDTLQLVIPISREDIVEWQYMAAIRLTVHLIDLGVLSYAGAHLNYFGKHYALENPRIFDLLTPFSGGLFKKQMTRDI